MASFPEMFPNQDDNINGVNPMNDGILPERRQEEQTPSYNTENSNLLLQLLTGIINKAESLNTELPIFHPSISDLVQNANSVINTLMKSVKPIVIDVPEQIIPTFQPSISQIISIGNNLMKPIFIIHDTTLTVKFNNVGYIIQECFNNSLLLLRNIIMKKKEPKPDIFGDVLPNEFVLTNIAEENPEENPEKKLIDKYVANIDNKNDVYYTTIKQSSRGGSKHKINWSKIDTQKIIRNVDKIVDTIVPNDFYNWHKYGKTYDSRGRGGTGTEAAAPKVQEELEIFFTDTPIINDNTPTPVPVPVSASVPISQNNTITITKTNTKKDDTNTEDAERYIYDLSIT